MRTQQRAAKRTTKQAPRRKSRAAVPLSAKAQEGKTFSPLHNPKVSCLCVTYNRHEFHEFLLWNYRKQTWLNRELIVVDGSDANHEAAFRGHTAESSGNNIVYLHMKATPNIAAKRNKCLELASGDIITWFDDDDWQHPRKCEILANLMDEKTAFAGCTSSLFYSLRSDRFHPYKGYSRVLFNSLGLRASEAQKLRFDEKVIKASDSGWLRKLYSANPHSAKNFKEFPLFFWLSHRRNISNPETARRFGQDAAQAGLHPILNGESEEFFNHARNLRKQLTGSEEPSPIEAYAPNRRTRNTMPRRHPARSKRTPSQKTRPRAPSLSSRDDFRLLTSQSDAEIRTPRGLPVRSTQTGLLPTTIAPKKQASRNNLTIPPSAGGNDRFRTGRNYLIKNIGRFQPVRRIPVAVTLAEQ